MKHLAAIQIEFLKCARKWDDLTLDEQKSYLQRHPKSKRRITAQPGQTAALEAVSDKYTRRSDKAIRKMQKGDVVATQVVEHGRRQNKYFKLDEKGRLWTSKFENTDWQLNDSQNLPQEITRNLKVVGPQLQNINIVNNTYFKTTKPIPAFVNAGTKPSNAWYGAARIHTTVFDRVVLPEGTPIQILAGGDFAIINGERKGVRFTDPAADPGPFEKQYGVDHTRKQLPLSVLARTNEAGAIISKPQRIKLPYRTDEQLKVQEKIEREYAVHEKINNAIKESGFTRGKIDVYNIGNARAKKIEQQGDVYFYPADFSKSHKHELMSQDESKIDKVKDALARKGIYTEKEKEQVSGGSDNYILKIYDEGKKLDSPTQKPVETAQETTSQQLARKARAKIHLKELKDGAATIKSFSNTDDIANWIRQTRQNFSKSEILKDFPSFYDYDANDIVEAYKKEQHPEEKYWPIDDMERSFKTFLNAQFSNAWMKDNEPNIYKDNNGVVQSIAVGFRDIGTWHDRPGEEDDDYPTWDPKSRDIATTKFKNWVTAQPWYRPNKMEIFVEPSEKKWVQFGIRRK